MIKSDNSTYFTKFELSKGYWQILLSEISPRFKQINGKFKPKISTKWIISNDMPKVKKFINNILSHTG